MSLRIDSQRGRRGGGGHPRGSTHPPLVVAVTGASGALYAVRLLQLLVAAGRPLSLIVSDHGYRLLDTEAGIDCEDALRLAVGAAAWDACVTSFSDRDRGAAPASGSAPSAGMVICPCSMGTLAAVAGGTSRSLIERAADVTLKERRPLVVVPRETPFSAIHLQNMLRLAQAGAVVMPASPGFYHRPSSVGALVDFVVARILDHLGVAQSVVPRWEGETAESRKERGKSSKEKGGRRQEREQPPGPRATRGRGPRRV